MQTNLNIVMIFAAIALYLAGCSKSASLKWSATRHSTAVETAAVGSSGDIPKLQAQSCLDPEASDLRSGVTMMACDGSLLNGSLDLSQALPGNIRQGVTIDGVTGTLVTADPPAYSLRAGDPDVTTAINLSAASPLLGMTEDTTECHNRLSDGQSVRNRGETVLYANGKFEFLIICWFGKWAMARAQWTPGQSAAWVDHDEATAVIDPLWRYDSLNSEGRDHFEHGVLLSLQLNLDNSVEGLYWQSASPAHENGIFRVAASSLGALSSASVIDQGDYNDSGFTPTGAVTPKNWLIANDIADETSYPSWSTFDFTIHGGQKYVSYEYSSVYNAGIAIKSYSNLENLVINNPDKVFPGLRHGYIVSHGGKVYLMAYDATAAAWKMAMADSVANLDWNQSIDLKLRDFFGAGSGWSEVTPGLRNMVNRMPDIFGFDFHDNQFHFFYRSGEYHKTSAADPDTGSVADRGVGVVRMNKISG